MNSDFITNIIDFIKPELIVLIPVLYAIGVGVKHSEINDKYIPRILAIVGISLSTIWVIGTSSISNFQEICLSLFTSIVQGILCAAGSVWFHQLIKQEKKE